MARTATAKKRAFLGEFWRWPLTFSQEPLFSERTALRAPAHSRSVGPEPDCKIRHEELGNLALFPATVFLMLFAPSFHRVRDRQKNSRFLGGPTVLILSVEALAKLCWIRSPIPRKARVLERLATISGWRGGLSRLPRNRIGELGSVSDLSLAYGHRPPVSPLLGAPAGGWGASPFELRSAGAAAG